MPPNPARPADWTGGDERFQATRWSLIDALSGTGDPSSMERFCSIYWYPAYCFVRRSGHGREESQDLVQDFFVSLLERETLAKVRKEQAKFRTFFILLLKRHLIDAFHRSHARKRSGGKIHVPITWDDAEHRFVAEATSSNDPEAAFERQWAEGVMTQALHRLRLECSSNLRHGPLLRELEPLLARDPVNGEYDALIARHGLTGGALRTTVMRLRKKYRDCVLDELRAECGPEADLEEARRDLLDALSR
jgi:RNA polymerase sigma-70 factor (ECF subfamily)